MFQPLFEAEIEERLHLAVNVFKPSVRRPTPLVLSACGRPPKSLNATRKIRSSDDPGDG
jgi:hypothetical protein